MHRGSRWTGLRRLGGGPSELQGGREIAIRRGFPEKAARMAEDTGRGLKGRKGPVEGEETQASPQGDGNPRGVDWFLLPLTARPLLCLDAAWHGSSSPAYAEGPASPGNKACSLAGQKLLPPQASPLWITGVGGGDACARGRVCAHVLRTPGPEGHGRSSLMLDECPQERQLPGSSPGGSRAFEGGDSVGVLGKIHI